MEIVKQSIKFIALKIQMATFTNCLLFWTIIPNENYFKNIWFKTTFRSFFIQIFFEGENLYILCEFQKRQNSKELP